MKLTRRHMEMLETADVWTHGVRLPAGVVRDALRRADLIRGYPAKVGHGKSWIITAKGREVLQREPK